VPAASPVTTCALASTRTSPPASRTRPCSTFVACETPLLPPDPDRDPVALAPVSARALAARWRRFAATPLGENVMVVCEALLYLALILLVAWLWQTPEADFRYWGF
jgi:hypothetical protein